MKKYSANKILEVSKKYEYAAESYKIRKNAVAPLIIMMILPLIAGTINKKATTPKELKEAVDNIISEINDLRSTVQSPKWTIALDYLKDVAVGATIGGLAGGTSVGTATLGLGAAPGWLVGALVGGGIGLVKGVFDHSQVNELVEKFPSLTGLIDKYQKRLELLLSLYGQIKTIHERLDNHSEQNFNSILKLLDNYPMVLRRVQIDGQILYDEIEKIKTGPQEFWDNLSHMTLNIFSDLKNVQDAIMKFGPEATRTSREAEDLRDEIKKAVEKAEKGELKGTSIESDEKTTTKSSDDDEFSEETSSKPQKTESGKTKDEEEELGWG